MCNSDEGKNEKKTGSKFIPTGSYIVMLRDE